MEGDRWIRGGCWGADTLRDCVGGLFAVGRVGRDGYHTPTLEQDPSGGSLVYRGDGRLVRRCIKLWEGDEE
jgi:hypothetical protein